MRMAEAGPTWVHLSHTKALAGTAAIRSRHNVTTQERIRNAILHLSLINIDGVSKRRSYRLYDIQNGYSFE